MTRKEAFVAQHPDAYFLDRGDLAGLAGHLRHLGWLGADEQVRSAEKPGEGNMNCTLRVLTSRRSVILKQARPWVEKYDHISAPWDRALIEGSFYELIAPHAALRDRMPGLLGIDRQSHMLMLEDLGHGSDFTGIYRGEPLAMSDVAELGGYLAALHRAFAGSEPGRFTNRAMRELNHRHIFLVPLMPDNGLSLDAITPGLEAVARRLKADAAYVRAVEALGRDYLGDGSTLVHGDFFPGSWLHTPDGPRVIDPEFCFIGPPEFDVGVMAGHLRLANQRDELMDHLLERYLSPPPPDWSDARQARVLQFAGVEIMRRLIGVAQLPLGCGIEHKAELLELSHDLVLSPATCGLAAGGGRLASPRGR